MKTFESIHVKEEKRKKLDLKEIKLWDPAITSYISIVLSPLFGSILHLLNWKRLKNNKMVYSNLAFTILYLPLFTLLIVFLDNSDYSNFLNFIPFYYEILVTLFYVSYWYIWHYFVAKQQVNFIKNQIYIKRKLWKPILITIGIPIIGIGIFLIWLVTVVF